MLVLGQLIQLFNYSCEKGPSFAKATIPLAIVNVYIIHWHLSGFAPDQRNERTVSTVSIIPIKRNERITLTTVSIIPINNNDSIETTVDQMQLLQTTCYYKVVSIHSLQTR